MLLLLIPNKHRRSQGDKKGHDSPKLLQNILLSCASRGSVPNKMLLLAWTQNIGSTQNFMLPTP